MIPNWKIYPRSQGHSTVYLKNVVNDPAITVGDYTIYDDFANDPRDFQRNNVLYHYPECNHDRLTIGKFCSIACGAMFNDTAATHTYALPPPYPLPISQRGVGSAHRCGLHHQGVGQPRRHRGGE